MSIHIKSLYRAIGLISLFCLLTPLTHAQTTPATAQLRPALQILDSTKDQDGLFGAVRRVKTEYARINLKDGQPFEGPRQLLEITTYGIRGNRVDNVSYPIPDSVAGREEYKYGPRGNVVEKILRDERGAVLTREAYEYVFDEVGNWTKMITNLVLIENGQLKREPVEVTYRTLTYYAIESNPQAILSAEAPATKNKQASESVADGPHIRKESGVVDGNSVASAPKNTPLQIKPPETTTPSQKPERPATDTTSSSSAISSVETPVTPQVQNNETETVNGNGSTEKAKSSTQKAAEVLTRSDSASTAWAERKSVDPAKQEDSAVGVNVGSQPELRKSPSGPETGPTSNPVVAINAPSNTEPISATNTASVSGAQKAYESYQSGLQKFEAGDVKGAIDAYLESVRLEPMSAVYQTNLGHAYVTLKKDKEAMKAFREAVKLNPELAEAFYGLGFASFRSSKYRDAMDAFKRATVLSPDMAKAHYGLAMAYVELDRMDAVIQEYRILQRLDSKLAAKLTKSLPDVDFSCVGTRYCR